MIYLYLEWNCQAIWSTVLFIASSQHWDYLQYTNEPRSIAIEHSPRRLQSPLLLRQLILWDECMRELDTERKTLGSRERSPQAVNKSNALCTYPFILFYESYFLPRKLFDERWMDRTRRGERDLPNEGNNPRAIVRPIKKKLRGRHRANGVRYIYIYIYIYYIEISLDNTREASDTRRDSSNRQLFPTFSRPLGRRFDWIISPLQVYIHTKMKDIPEIVWKRGGWGRFYHSRVYSSEIYSRDSPTRYT